MLKQVQPELDIAAASGNRALDFARDPRDAVQRGADALHRRRQPFRGKDARAEVRSARLRTGFDERKDGAAGLSERSAAGMLSR